MGFFWAPRIALAAGVIGVAVPLAAAQGSTLIIDDFEQAEQQSVAIGPGNLSAPPFGTDSSTVLGPLGAIGDRTLSIVNGPLGSNASAGIPAPGVTGFLGFNGALLGASQFEVLYSATGGLNLDLSGFSALLLDVIEADDEPGITVEFSFTLTGSAGSQSQSFFVGEETGLFGVDLGLFDPALLGDVDEILLTLDTTNSPAASFVIESITAAVPLPAAGWLMLAGLAALAARRRGANDLAQSA